MMGNLLTFSCLRGIEWREIRERRRGMVKICRLWARGLAQWRKLPKRRAAAMAAVVGLMLSTAGLSGACPAPIEKNPDTAERFGEVHWYYADFQCR